MPAGFGSSGRGGSLFSSRGGASSLRNNSPFNYVIIAFLIILVIVSIVIVIFIVLGNAESNLQSTSPTGNLIETV